MRMHVCTHVCPRLVRQFATTFQSRFVLPGARAGPAKLDGGANRDKLYACMYACMYACHAYAFMCGMLCMYACLRVCMHAC